jgi:hypothetical protein
VASSRPVRQKFRGSVSSEAQPGAWSMGFGADRSGDNLRKGTVT